MNKKFRLAKLHLLNQSDTDGMTAVNAAGREGGLFPKVGLALRGDESGRGPPLPPFPGGGKIESSEDARALVNPTSPQLTTVGAFRNSYESKTYYITFSKEHH